MRSTVLFLHTILLATVLAQPGGGGGGGGAAGNVHTTFGPVSDCTPPACGDFSLSIDEITEIFAPFHPDATVDTTFSYCGAWWANAVGPRVDLDPTFCTTGPGVTDQVCDDVVYDGVTIATADDGSYSIESYNQPLHECENYCGVSQTPPLLESTFDTLRTRSHTLTPSNSQRSDISNAVGTAVNGVTIFSPFTRPGSVAVYAESLDTSRGHPANGMYHYHGYTTAIYNETMAEVLSATQHGRIMGIAYDGFPIYGPVGYSDPLNPQSTLTVLQTGYVCRGGSTGEEPCTDIELQDPNNFSYDATNADVDECNGRYGVTPEFPNGMYYYVMTVDSSSGDPTFPGLPYCVQSKAAVTVDSGVDAPTATTPTNAPTATIVTDDGSGGLAMGEGDPLTSSSAGVSFMVRIIDRVPYRSVSPLLPTVSGDDDRFHWCSLGY